MGRRIGLGVVAPETNDDKTVKGLKADVKAITKELENANATITKLTAEVEEFKKASK